MEADSSFQKYASELWVWSSSHLELPNAENASTISKTTAYDRRLFEQASRLFLAITQFNADCSKSFKAILISNVYVFSIFLTLFSFVFAIPRQFVSSSAFCAPKRIFWNF